MTNSKAFQVSAGQDRFQEKPLMIWGLIPLTIKLSSRDTDGALFVFEHNEMGKGGPPRHVHHGQDEWFYVIAGDFAFEIGDETFRLGPGGSIFAPRKIPHGWAHIGEGQGTLLTMVSPADSFEEFLLETTKYDTLPSPEAVNQAFADHDMTVVGPPLDVT